MSTQKVEQYRITKQGKGKEIIYKLQGTYGLLDVRTLGIFPLLQSARDYAKSHALLSGQTKPIILF